MSLSRKTKALAGELRTHVSINFSKSEYAEDVEQELTSYSPYLENEEIYGILLGQNWDEVPLEVFRSVCPYPFLLRDASFRYFLPGFLIAAIDCEELTDRLTFEFRVPKKTPRVKAFRTKFGPLDAGKRQTVVAFLEYSKSCLLTNDQYPNSYCEREKVRIEDSICYWSKSEQSRLR